MNPDKNGDEKLPDGWMLCQSKSNPGRKYYFNKKTGKSSWTQPQDDDKTEENNAKCKKEKDNQNQETSKKEEPRKNLKRKSDGKEDSFSKKKQKPEIQTPEKRKPELSKIESPVKCPDSSKKDSPKKPTPAKNLANTRLSQLRAELSSDISHKPDEEKSPVKNKRYSPKSSHSSSYSSSHSDAKIPKLDLKSPSHTESKSSTTQSPSSDSLQSVPSPSQFFAANKIISSMKAQLPDEYKHTVKPKDTFADIEEGICNQTAEYPFMKHPATPPQFSEASKLMSAIKSKLSYKVATKDTNVKQFSSAKDRMESLRKSLGNEGDVKDIPNHTTCMQNHSLSRQEFPKYIEAMEVDCKEVAQNMPTFPGRNGNTVSKENVVLVVDTNVFIHELDVIKNVLNSHIKGYSEQPTLLVPWRVINELDRLKDNNNGNGAICKRARAAMDYLYKSLPENNRIKGQSLRDSNSHIYPCELPDDEILNCCLQQGERGKSVILLSNDKNLCNKAVVNGVRCIGLLELKPLLESQPQPAADPRLYPGVKHYETNMHRLLANILENEMRAKYHNLWQHVLFKAPPWSLADVLQCLLKHWIAVFSEVFPRIEHLITDLRNALVAIESKDPKSLSQSEVSNFKELCLELARKCQIIPEYMELAKTTVERLLRKCGDDRREMAVIDAFEGLWTVLSSYCAKLSSALGISHSLEDKVAGAEPLHALTGKWPVFSRQIHALTGAMKGALDTDSADPALSEHVTRLETVFKDSLALVCSETSAVNRDNMRLFCTSCRNMLQEAHGKFSELTTLLGVCENHLANK